MRDGGDRIETRERQGWEDRDKIRLDGEEHRVEIGERKKERRGIG